MSEPHPWRCQHCHARLAWTATTVGCPRCRTVTTLPSNKDKDQQQ